MDAGAAARVGCCSRIRHLPNLPPTYCRNCADVQITGDASSGSDRKAGNSQSSRKALLPVTQVGKQAFDI